MLATIAALFGTTMTSDGHARTKLEAPQARLWSAMAFTISEIDADRIGPTAMTTGPPSATGYWTRDVARRFKTYCVFLYGGAKAADVAPLFLAGLLIPILRGGAARNELGRSLGVQILHLADKTNYGPASVEQRIPLRWLELNPFGPFGRFVRRHIRLWHPRQVLGFLLQAALIVGGRSPPPEGHLQGQPGR